jgi:LemA protein
MASLNEHGGGFCCKPLWLAILMISLQIGALNGMMFMYEIDTIPDTSSLSQLLDSPVSLPEKVGVLATILAVPIMVLAMLTYSGEFFDSSAFLSALVWYTRHTYVKKSLKYRALLVFWLISIYNGLVGLRQRVNQSFADIDVQLKQRHDLIPNLVETVKGYATHEKSTLDAVIQARNSALSAQGPGQQAAAEGALTGALGRLIALGEAYPDLKANTNFQQLQTELADIENKLSAARRFFNNSVSEYNASIQAFPAVFFASNLGFSQREFFDVGEDSRKQLDVTPSVKF